MCITACLTAAFFAAHIAGAQTAINTSMLSRMHFRCIGPAAMSGRITDVAVLESDPTLMYIASATGGVWKTTDNATTLTPVFEKEKVHSVGALGLFQGDPNVIWIGTGEGTNRQSSGWSDGIYKSTDGGRIWTNTGLPESGHVARIITHPTNRDIVYVAVPGKLWGPSAERGLYKTMDPYTSSISYEERRAGIYRSGDRGATWRRMGDWNPRPGYSSKLTVDPSDERRLYQVRYSVSDDSGHTWREPKQTLHGDDRIIWVNPRDSRHIVRGDDGGLGVSYDSGVHWLFQRALPVSQFYHIGLDSSVPFRICGGLQDNSHWCGPSATDWTDGILNDNWFTISGGDGVHAQFDTTDNRSARAPRNGCTVTGYRAIACQSYRRQCGNIPRIHAVINSVRRVPATPRVGTPS